MKTGEGKTLVSTATGILKRTGRQRAFISLRSMIIWQSVMRSGWERYMNFSDLTVGVILNGMDNKERQAAYNCDITYVTNNELGFDYLRDNMVIYKEQLVQRGLHYAIIDEVDSVLIDEARTPLIISGQSGKSTRLYEACDILARQMQRGEDQQEYTKMDAIMGVEVEEDRRLRCQ